MNERISIMDQRPKVKSQNRLPQIQRKKNHSKTKNSPVDWILFFQRTAGNQAVQRLIKSGALQAKLRIGQPRDIYEKEADRVAEQVMRMPEPPVVTSGTPYIHSIQRACISSEDEVLSRQPIEEEELRRQPIEEEEEEELQAKATSDGISEVNPDIESHIQTMRGGGHPLPESTRAFFEPRFGNDFSQVRVHSDAKAAESAREVNAKAYTVGRNVMFGEGEYAPETASGQRLLAHELVHVVQQKDTNTSLLSLNNSVSNLEKAKTVSDLIDTEHVSEFHKTHSPSIQREEGGTEPADHRFTAEGVSVVVRRNCAPDEFGFAVVEEATKTALNRIFNSECIEESRRTRIQRNLTRHGLDIRCRRSATIGGACAEATGFFIPANILTVGSAGFPGHVDNTGRCVGAPASSILHEIVHLTRGVYPEGLPESCENSCFPGSESTSPDLCRDIDVFGRRVERSP